jgi:hypothetical protein
MERISRGSENSLEQANTKDKRKLLDDLSRFIGRLPLAANLTILINEPVI